MKTTIISTLVICALFISGNNKFKESPDLTGAWELMTQNGEVVSQTKIRIITEKYFSEGGYYLLDKKFDGASAGAYTITDNTLKEVYLANSWNSAEIGIVYTYEIETAGNTLLKTGRKNGKKWIEKWKRLQYDKKYDLAGAWRISGRVVDGDFVEMPNRPRKTLKILSENRFQWIAFNSETREFFGTGGGRYDIQDGKYTEHIEFFSRDSTRVGMNLSFDFEMTDKGWHHSGTGSTGNPVDEFWINADKEN